MPTRRPTAPDARPTRLRLAELAILALLIVIFIGFVIDKVWELRAAAERLAVIRTVNAIRSSLGTEAMQRAIAGETASLASLHHGNPMTLVDDKPPGYLGRLNKPDPAQIPGYQWYFDTDRKVLVYRVANSDHFASSLAGVPRIRFQLQASYRDRNGNGRFDRGVEGLEGLNLVGLEDYHWKMRE